MRGFSICRPRKPKRALPSSSSNSASRTISIKRASDLPLGIRQRLSLAVAIVHEPEMLILDEPTSGVDPLARDRFWELLIDLSRNQGVTIFVSTHFMNEAERCDRISLMDSGRVLATDTPANLIRARGVSTLEDAFISYLEEATGSRAAEAVYGCAVGQDRRTAAAAAAAATRVQPAASLRLHDPGNDRASARSHPADLRLVRHGALDAGLRLRNFDRRQQSHLRGARSRPRATRAAPTSRS